ncbi:MAG: hypothetical protein E7315_00430 [Clostridiales bacterium]|nr:hypothetical protein [Clostridiales bacterium]
MKKLISIMLILAVALVCFGGCIGAPTETIIPTPEATPTPDVPDTTPEPLKILEFSTVRDSAESNFTRTPVVEYFLETWGLKCTKILKYWVGMSSDGYEWELASMLGHSTDRPDVVFNAVLDKNGEYFNDAIKDSNAVDFMEYIENGRLDNYINNVWGGFTDAWDYARTAYINKETDELYILPGRNYEVAYYTWLYNSNYYDTRYNTDVPPSDLDTIVRIMKNYVSENPGCSAMLYDWGPSMNDKWGQWGYFEREPIFNAYGVVHTNNWKLGKDGPVYGLMQDAHFEAMKLYKALMDEKIMFAYDRNSYENGKAAYADKASALQNNGALFAWYNVTELIQMNNTAKAANENYEWSILPEDPSAKGIEPVAYSSTMFTRTGVVMSAKAAPELKDRVIDIINWFASPEGEKTYFYGIEGVSYEVVDGKVKFLKYYNDELTPDMSYMSNNETETVEYYRVGISFSENKSHISMYTEYEGETEVYKAIFTEKTSKMEPRYEPVWGDADAVAQSMGKTAKEIEEMEDDVFDICSDWRSAYYRGDVGDESYAQMKADAIAAGYETVLAYRKALYEDAMK